jgi:hypothetical protein
MKIKERIIATIQEAIPDLLLLNDPYTVITAAGMILIDIPIQNTDDIDILVSARDELLLQKIWSNRLVNNFQTHNDHLFNSCIHRYHFSLIDIEVMANLKVNKPEGWIPVEINEALQIQINKDFTITVPTKGEQKRLLQLFGRDKDMQRLSLFK